MRRFCFLFVLLGLLSARPVCAQDAAGAPALSKTKDPVEITADDAIEWLRDQHLYRARGKAMVKQGDTTINADLIEAAYQPGPNGQGGQEGGEQNIQTVTATGHVTIVSSKDGQTRTITAQQGVYQLATGQLLLTGDNLKITSPTLTVTARDALSYDRAANKATARGQAVIQMPDKTLKADAVDAWFTPANTLSKAAARGHVIIQTPDDLLLADNGDYDAVKQSATLIGHVQLTQGQNHLQGGRAVVNLQTGVSQLFGDTATPASNATPGIATPGAGRVRAVFFPNGDKGGMPDATAGLIPMRPGDRPLTPKGRGALPPTAQRN